MSVLVLDYSQLDTAMTLTDYCTCIRVKVQKKYSESVQLCTNFKAKAFRDMLMVAQLFQKLQPQHPLRLSIASVIL
jgi:hypothetical protein